MITFVRNKVRMLNYLQIPTIFWIDGKISIIICWKWKDIYSIVQRIFVAVEGIYNCIYLSQWTIKLTRIKEYHTLHCHSSGGNLFSYLFVILAVKLSNNFQRMPPFSLSYTIVPRIFFSSLALYIEITGDHLSCFQCNRWTAGQIFCICKVLEKGMRVLESTRLVIICIFQESLNPVDK
jgi:hypothetical protein